ncbi:hypothetical protein RHRU231_750146 [Rhodococcus ruber]|uniref:Uncharacterized protein n=1 Tax=Rhodococcus ruber TaxID=1830 RepID=A0A098BQ09_9NOCA|nr:hypothetical protein RHRU231_750146 [Rhodococcus ruber]
MRCGSAGISIDPFCASNVRVVLAPDSSPVPLSLPHPARPIASIAAAPIAAARRTRPSPSTRIAHSHMSVRRAPARTQLVRLTEPTLRAKRYVSGPRRPLTRRAGPSRRLPRHRVATTAAAHAPPLRCGGRPCRNPDLGEAGNTASVDTLAS